ncbi:glycosyltransferase family 2 protein [Lysobacter sp. H21R4]|uniref:glycosyltransferase family 2 protein n=1 Tax=Lysobacter sp. H21R4 TaxID=2781021 RepID=UPI001886F729|nr:glycosyltransferase family A protein [Lysobacter sp. H21R4]QOY61990.1 glycosyltransferase family 2 protein [Lysobacter sp. H21R4]
MNESAPLVSVIMPVYNGERFFEAALLSALEQDFDDFEIVVLDDGSTDRSTAIGRSYAADHPRRVRYFRQANGGFCSARNAAIAHARGRYLALLDADDLWMRHHLANAVAALESTAGTALVHADVRFIDEHGAVLADYRDPDRWAKWGHDPFTAILLRYEHVACTTAVFPRDLALQLGGFDVRYTGLGCEDRDMWLRLSLQGRVTHLSYHAADYRVHSGGVSRHSDRMVKARRLLVDRMLEFPQGRRLRRPALSAVALSEAEEADCGPIRQVGAYARAIWLRPIDPRAWRGVMRALWDVAAVR